MAKHPRAAVAALTLAISMLVVGLHAQTVIKLPKNKYSPQQDVELGLKAAAEVRKQFPVIQDEKIAVYLTKIGDRLVAAAPRELKEPVYQFSFTPVNVKEINAFALPGGPMFVHRGMFDAASSEAEVAGVMAHELSHVLLRHGTANATKAQNPWLQIGQMAGQIGGAMVGGAAGSAIAQGSQMGLGAMLLRYSRDYEKQADLLGAQIMARAGYDPRALAHMFETIENESRGSGGGDTPQWLSSHPNPGNRTQYITKEAESLQVASAVDMSGFEGIKTEFSSLPPARTMAEVESGKAAGGSTALASVGTPGQPVPPPSAEYKQINGGKIFQAAVPSDWTLLQGESEIKAVPQNAYGPMNGQTVQTHGVEFGILQVPSKDLREATNNWLRAVGQANPDMKLGGQQRAVNISQRTGLATPIVNPSPLGGKEIIGVYTTFVADGVLFYYITVAPEKDVQAFDEAFKKIGESIKLPSPR